MYFPMAKIVLLKDYHCVEVQFEWLLATVAPPDLDLCHLLLILARNSYFGNR